MPLPKNSPAPNRITLTGKSFGRLKVLGPGERRGKTLFWNCVCECGSLTSVRSQPLRLGMSRSCGCARREYDIGDRTRTHGMKWTRTYTIWCQMRARCSNPKSIMYHRYGGRGISVCKSWQESFEAFLADMGEAPADASIDRIDNDLGYSKENCRWASRVTQNRNKSNTLRYSAHGLTLCLPEWVELTGIKYATLYKRLVTLRQNPERAIPFIAVKAEAQKRGGGWLVEEF